MEPFDFIKTFSSQQKNAICLIDCTGFSLNIEMCFLNLCFILRAVISPPAFYSANQVR